jgi:hypothetical protein
MLIIAYFLHLQHPHPKVAPFSIPPRQHFGHVLLISPSGPVPTSAASFTTNAEKDMLKPESVQHMWSVLEANHDMDVDIVNPWLAPALRLEEDWYKNWPVGKITIIWGEDEILRDDIVTVSEVIKVGEPYPFEMQNQSNLLI